MKRAILELLRQPGTGAELKLEVFREEDSEILEGVIRAPDGAAYPILDGVPLFAPTAWDPAPLEAFAAKHGVKGIALAEMDSGAKTTADSFGDQWNIWEKFPPEYTEFRRQWFVAKLGCDDATFGDLVRSKRAILDAGTGVGYKLELMAAESRDAAIVGVDLSDAVVPAFRNCRKYPNVHVIQADIFALPFRRDCFDLVMSDGVIHHTPSTEKAFYALCDFLAAGGDVSIHVYKKMGAIREFTDDLIRERATKLSTEECREWVKQFTDFGKALAEQDVEIDIPSDIPILGIPKGRHSLQRFFYYTIFQCHWNPTLSYEQNNMIHFDWFHPHYAWRHTDEEVLGWFANRGLREIRRLVTNVKGVTVVAKR
jgi:SAM-dependent methyltransferase/uncharacterized protein YbaR (Trm112 family)